jgi:RNA polymerase subunit RPABC4/transcription elongation factor Spt4
VVELSAERRCPACGALVTPDADWCGQCFASLAGPAAASRSPTIHDTAPTADAGPANGAPPGAYWTCPSCHADNDIDRDACSVCGTPFTSLFADERRPASVPRGRAVAWSLVYPGLGHRLAGHAGDGLARAAVFTLAIGAIFFLLLARGGNALAPIVGFLTVYAVFAVGIYAFTAVEAGHLADGGAPFASPRAFAWLAAALVVVSLGVAVFIAVGATRAR